ncbi:type VII secretion protein EccCa [Streptomyces kunmingensis]|uniref:Type VII secretion protein EccCa n=1 Tax=Streptomyces kunmingensis TaxID=68225 RepID=A0ABU6CE57_9ACTN|nr:type VII secretion protein EccCa [Streptomyces kunmingensis]MEB3962994.1 type VII secretion protein EccCa [Streptomyces kunmingensis]
MVFFRRTARRRGPEMPSGEMVMQEPPVMAESVPAGGAGILTYLPMILMSGAMVLLYSRSGSSSSPMTYLVVGIMAVAMGAMLVGQLMRAGAERKQKLKGARRDYLRYLGGARQKVRSAVSEQQQALAWRHPAPTMLWSIARSSRLWERRTSDEDFGEVRLAIGEQRLALHLTATSTRPVEDVDPLTAHALRAFINAYATVPDQPIAIFLPTWARVLLRGERGEVRDLVRAMLSQLAVLHSPQEMVIAFCVDSELRAEWDWGKWLPHALHPHDKDGAGPTRLIASSVSELEDLLSEEFSERPPFEAGAVASQDEPYTVIVVDGGQVPSDHALVRRGLRNTVVLDLSGELPWRPGRTTLRLSVVDGEVQLVRTDRNRRETLTLLGRADRLGATSARSLASLLAPMRTGAKAETAQPLQTDIQLTTLLGIPDLHRHDPAAYWERRQGNAAQRLRVPIAVGADGRPVHLDIKESAENGMGPHGMLIGATGSGKSELLRTLVLGLALAHSSETLNFVLVDFKGGATFLGLDQLPHTSAVITNLADEATLVGRMQDALHGELIRRQELLRAAGNFSSALDYEKARATGVPLSPLPSLFIVVDEFSELLSAHREFMDLFVMIGRLGRSLGVHLLLASQRLDEGRMNQLESHLSYRIGLRTFSAMESRGVLGVPDAYELPSQPGAGFLKSGIEPLTRFRAAYVSGTYRHRTENMTQARVASQVVPWTGEWVAARTIAPAAEAEEPAVSAGQDGDGGAALLSVAIDRLKESGPPAHQVWLPPLAEPPTLDRLLPPLSPHPLHGLTTVGWSERGSLKVPVGVIDRPFEQKRDLLMIDLSGSGGHLAIAGGPQSGKSTLVRDVIAAVALTHTPREVQFYCLDFGGGALSSLRGLPHVGSVASSMDTERVSRTLAEVTSLLARRERLFLEHEIDSMATLRRRRAAGEFPAEEHGDVFLVVDGWSTVRQDFQDDIATFNQLATRGLNYGIHLITTATRWVDFSAAVRDQSATKLELRMGDAMDSMVDIRRAQSVPRHPGRGLTPDSKLHFMTALPRIDSVENTDSLAEGVAELVSAVAESWTGPVAPPVRMLPTFLDARELPTAQEDRPFMLPLGVEETELATAWQDLSQTPHLVLFGDTESGKTNLLRLVAQHVVEHFTPEEAKILVVDYRRELVDAVPEEYRLGHAVSVDQLDELLAGTAKAFKTRLPGTDISPARMRKADWWAGPRLFVLVDDYDLMARPMTTPFEPLMEHLPLGYELGLHMVVARAAAGGLRGMNDPLIRRLLEVNAPGLLMSCPPSEGYLFGNVKPRTLPPGRGMYVTRRGTVQMQTAVAEKTAEQMQ